MPTHQIHDLKDTVYFATFTCFDWLNLFEMTNCYHQFDKWFEYLELNHISLLGYVIMPNHFHGLLFIPEECKKNLNQVIGNGKRFLAYEIRDQLKNQKEDLLLTRLKNAVAEKEKKKGKKHQVFRPSFDAKNCFSKEMVQTKLDYIHFNPVRGKWNLVEDYTDYPYSSVAFYEKGELHKYVKHYMDFI